ncbi:MAG: hypothetical protein GF320_16125 [Armatimonadia bacterium]|nr:hypothetical protein [Armatimonadia bacterium]
MRCHVLCSLALLLIVVAGLPSAAQEAEEQEPYPDYGPSQDRVELRYQPEPGTTRSYELSWSFGLDVPLSGHRKVEGEGIVHLQCVAAEEGVSTLLATFEGFENRMEGTTYGVNFPADGLTLTVDDRRRVLTTSHDVESMAALLLRSLFAAAFAERRLEIGMSWRHDLSLMDPPAPDGEDVRGPDYWPDRPDATDVLPDDADKERDRQAEHILAAVQPLDGGDRIAALISDIELAFSLEAYGLGTLGRLGVEMHSEFWESTGELRWARATGGGRLQTLAVVSVPIEDLVILATLYDPRTGEAVEPMAQYARPAPYEPPADDQEGEEPGTQPAEAPESSPREDLPPDHPLRRR